MVYAFACNACAEPIGLVRAPKEVSDMNYIAGTAGEEVKILRAPRENAGADSPMPPKKRSGIGDVALNAGGPRRLKRLDGTISAINLANDEIVRRVALGETQDVVRTYQA